MVPVGSERGWSRQLVVIGPHRGAHRVALRVGLSMGSPIILLVAIGQTSWIPFAVFGACCSLYGRAEAHLARFRMQMTVALTLVATVVAGVAVGISPSRAWLVVPVAGAVATLIQVLAHTRGWHPPGTLIHVFALTSCAVLPATGRDLATAAAIALAGAAWALAVGVAGRLRPSARHHHPDRRTGRVRKVDPAGAVETGLVVMIAGLIPTVTGLGHPYWSMVAAAAAIGGADRAARLVRAVHRAAGTLVGVAVTALVLLPGPATWLLVAVAVVAPIGAELFVGRNYGLALIFVTPLALSMTQLIHTTDPVILLRDRTFETLIGATVGVVATVLRHPRHSRTTLVRADAA